MAISKKWSHYTKENVMKIPTNLIGHYELANTNTKSILYIGEGLLRARLLAHLPDGKRNEETVVGANGFRYEVTNNKKKAVSSQNENLAVFKDKNDKLPKYNKKSKN